MSWLRFKARIERPLNKYRDNDVGKELVVALEIEILG